MSSPFIQILSVSSITGLRGRIVVDRLSLSGSLPTPGRCPSVRRVREPHELERRDHRHVDSDPAPTQTTAFERIVRSTSTGAPAGGGNGETPPGSNPVAAQTSGGRATRVSAAPTAAATFAGSARRFPGRAPAPAVRRHTKTRDLTIWSRSHPIASAAAVRRRRAGVANSSSRDSAPAGSEEGGDALDRLGPRHRAIVGRATRRRQYTSGTMRQRTASQYACSRRRPGRAASPRRGSSRPRGRRGRQSATSAGMLAKSE